MLANTTSSDPGLEQQALTIGRTISNDKRRLHNHGPITSKQNHVPVDRKEEPPAAASPALRPADYSVRQTQLRYLKSVRPGSPVGLPSTPQRLKSLLPVQPPKEFPSFLAISRKSRCRRSTWSRLSNQSSRGPRGAQNPNDHQKSSPCARPIIRN